MAIHPVRRALLSVSDKTGLIEFSRLLAGRGVELFSTGGTRAHLEQAGLAVRDISAYTGFPEMMDGRLKTLHPKVFGGLLARPNRPDDLESLAAHGILTFELVVVNLYPFEATVAKAGVSPEQAIEQIDIGGPSLLRAAAKNHLFTTVVTGPGQFAAVAAELLEHGGTTFELRRRLAAEAFARTAQYDGAISAWFARQESPDAFPPALNLSYTRQAVLRYGENPHQKAAVYAEAAAGGAPARGASLVSGTKRHGKELSYNNLLDLDSALAIVSPLSRPAACVVKHNNPCGAAWSESLHAAAAAALEGDVQSAFGGVLGFNRPVDGATAEVLAAPGLFIEAIVAPSFEPEAFEILTTRPKWRANVRLVEVGPISPPAPARALRQIAGGLLVQDADIGTSPASEWKVVTQAQPSETQQLELSFAWEICRHVKSNAIVLTSGGMLQGAGAGQMSRVDAVEIAIRKAGARAAGSVLASDAFFPFADSIHKAAAAGVTALIQPGGSVKDDEVIAACNDHGLPMIFTGRRHFRHYLDCVGARNGPCLVEPAAEGEEFRIGPRLRLRVQRSGCGLN